MRKVEYRQRGPVPQEVIAAVDLPVSAPASGERDGKILVVPK